MKNYLLLVVVACGGGSSDLDADVVTSIPPGNAMGTAMTGTYRMESLTTDCSGKCSTMIDGFLYSACDIGTRLEDTVVVTQTDGKLQIDVEDSDYVSRLAGGIDANNAFDVGGKRTQLGGGVLITARSQGAFVGTMIDAVARLRVSGSGLDCVIESEVTGTKR